MFVPMPGKRTEPKLCPKCGNVEDKMELCRHCKYEYPVGDSDTGVYIFIGWWVLAGAVLGGIFIGKEFIYSSSFYSPSVIDNILSIVLGSLLGAISSFFALLVLMGLFFLVVETIIKIVDSFNK